MLRFKETRRSLIRSTFSGVTSGRSSPRCHLYGSHAFLWGAVASLAVAGQDALLPGDGSVACGQIAQDEAQSLRRFRGYASRKTERANRYTDIQWQHCQTITPNHQFSGAMLVSGRVSSFYPPLKTWEYITCIAKCSLLSKAYMLWCPH